MRRWVSLGALLAALGCSGLDEGEGGIVALEIEFPTTNELEIDERLQLSARALDADGQVVDAPITWRASNTSLTVDATGLVTAVAVGPAQVQASAGSLSSEQIPFTVVLRPDTLIIDGDSVVVIPRDADPPLTPTLAARLESFDPAGPVGSRPILFEIVQPAAGETPLVQFAGGGQSASPTTDANGRAGIVFAAVTGQVPPDTAIVRISATRVRGAPVPGSGQRFIILFQ